MYLFVLNTVGTKFHTDIIKLMVFVIIRFPEVREIE